MEKKKLEGFRTDRRRDSIVRVDVHGGVDVHYPVAEEHVWIAGAGVLEVFWLEADVWMETVAPVYGDEIERLWTCYHPGGPLAYEVGWNGKESLSFLVGGHFSRRNWLFFLKYVL
jgi:hypothetical protein